MLYGAKCSKCGLTQLPNATCKACGAVLETPPEAPRRASPRASSGDVSKPTLRAFSNATSQVSPKAPLEMTLDIPFEDSRQVPSRAPSEGPKSKMAKTCSECGMVYFEDELIQFGDALVCGKCKPLFVQKLREGVATAGEIVYAGFWIRVGAKFIDGIILGIVGLIIGFGIGSLHAGKGGSIFAENLSRAIAIVYVTYFLGKFGATPGKMACGLKVVRSDGERISYGRACGRIFAESLGILTLGIGYIIAAFDEEKRALHDRVCDTRVIKA